MGELLTNGEQVVPVPSAIYLRPVVLYHVAVFIQNLQFGYWWSLHSVLCSRSSGIASQYAVIRYASLDGVKIQSVR
jgi:hypothetical protein